ncbi:hypothetical protein B0H19DRAFT_1068966 [Mycena capillaripes]|nr:hypothetical protein B0H19DRAFT_1068966 [Mycena capillaripes]
MAGIGGRRQEMIPGAGGGTKAAVGAAQKAAVGVGGGVRIGRKQRQGWRRGRVHAHPAEARSGRVTAGEGAHASCRVAVRNRQHGRAQKKRWAAGEGLQCETGGRGGPKRSNGVHGGLRIGQTLRRVARGAAESVPPVARGEARKSSNRGYGVGCAKAHSGAATSDALAFASARVCSGGGGGSASHRRGSQMGQGAGAAQGYTHRIWAVLSAAAGTKAWWGVCGSGTGDGHKNSAGRVQKRRQTAHLGAERSCFLRGAAQRGSGGGGGAIKTKADEPQNWRQRPRGAISERYAAAVEWLKESMDAKLAAAAARRRHTCEACGSIGGAVGGGCETVE